jgi:hypothetical protein
MLFSAYAAKVSLARVFRGGPLILPLACATHRVPVRSELAAGMTVARPETSSSFPSGTEWRTGPRLSGSVPRPAPSGKRQRRISSNHMTISAEPHRTRPRAGEAARAAARGLILGISQDDLGQRDAGKVLSGFGVHYLKLLAFTNESGNVVEIHVAASGGIVQPAIPYFLMTTVAGFVSVPMLRRTNGKCILT